MDQSIPTRDPIEGLSFTFASDEALYASSPEMDDDAEGPFHVRPQLHLGETPLTDLRSLGSSALVHVVLIIAASFMVLKVALPRTEQERPTVMKGDFDPVDNRADVKKTAGSGGGGSPGEIGGLGSVAFVAPPNPDNSQSVPDRAADALLNEILPSTVQKPPDALQRACLARRPRVWA